MLNTLSIGIHRKHLAAFAKQMNQVSPVSASGVEHTRILADISAQDLIEDVNIDLAELFLYAQCHDYPFQSEVVPDGIVSPFKEWQLKSFGRDDPLKEEPSPEQNRPL
jgi:hypothetical protein